MEKSYGENEVGISAKRCPSPLPSTLRTAFPLHRSTREPSTRSESASGTDSPTEPGTTASAGDCELPEHLESDSIATVHLSAAPERTSLIKGQQLDYRRQHSHSSIHGKSFLIIIYQAHLHLLC